MVCVHCVGMQVLTMWITSLSYVMVATLMT